MFGVGDEVICVDDRKPMGWTSDVFPEWVQKDKKYTIREILDNEGIVVGILLDELVNPRIWQELIGRVQESVFATWRFRKLKTAYAVKEESEYAKKPKELIEL